MMPESDALGHCDADLKDINRDGLPVRYRQRKVGYGKTRILRF